MRPELVTFSSKLVEDTGTDSLDLVELVMEIEKDFAVTIPDEEVERMKTVADVIRYVDRNRRSQSDQALL